MNRSPVPFDHLHSTSPVHTQRKRGMRQNSAITSNSASVMKILLFLPGWPQQGSNGLLDGNGIAEIYLLLPLKCVFIQCCGVLVGGGALLWGRCTLCVHILQYVKSN